MALSAGLPHGALSREEAKCKAADDWGPYSAPVTHYPSPIYRPRISQRQRRIRARRQHKFS